MTRHANASIAVADHGLRLKLMAAACCAALLLGGCASRDMSDLREYADSVRARKGGRIPPIPEIASYEGHEYSAANVRSPFVDEMSISPPAPPGESGIGPIVGRVKEHLENFPLDSLSMVGTLEIQGQLYALVRDADGLVHQVREGQYLGQNEGRIVAISGAAIDVEEIVLNGNGDGYLQREARVALN